MEDIEIQQLKYSAKVLNYIKDKKMNTEKYTMQEFSLYPGGYKLIDKKQREIVIYYDLLFENIKVVYVNLKKEHEELIYDIKEALWEDYLNQADCLSQEVWTEVKNDDNTIQFRRTIKDKNGNDKIVHKSKKFYLISNLYDLYEYLDTEITKMSDERKNKMSI